MNDRRIDGFFYGRFMDDVLQPARNFRVRRVQRGIRQASSGGPQQAWLSDGLRFFGFVGTPA